MRWTAFLCSLVSMSIAGHCRVHTHPIAVPAALALEYPAYGPVYSAGGGDEDTRKILRILEGIDRRLRALEGGGQAPKGRMPEADAPPAAANPAMTVFTANCAACHDKATAKKGGGFAFLDGGSFTTDIDALQLGLIGAHVRSGHMPPASRAKLPAKDKDAVTGFIDGVFVSAKAESGK